MEAAAASDFIPLPLPFTLPREIPFCDEALVLEVEEVSDVPNSPLSYSASAVCRELLRVTGMITTGSTHTLDVPADRADQRGNLRRKKCVVPGVPIIHHFVKWVLRVFFVHGTGELDESEYSAIFGWYHGQDALEVYLGEVYFRK